MEKDKIPISIVLKEGATVPVYTSEQTTGADVRAAIIDHVVLQPGASALIPTGLRFIIPEGYEIQVRPISSLALKHGVTVLNSPGIIDANYCEDLEIILINYGKEPFVATPQMVIAQVILIPVCQAKFISESECTITPTEDKDSNDDTHHHSFLDSIKNIFKNNKKTSLLDYLDDRLVVFLDIENRDEAIKALITALDKRYTLKDKEKFYQAIWDREKIVSTGVGLGIAIPHAKLQVYDDFFIAIGVKSGKGIEWDALDGLPVHLIFMIGGPDNRQVDYLNLLSQLTAAIKDEERRKKISRAVSAEEVISLLKGD